MLALPEPEGKLDAMAGYSWSTPAVATAPVNVNGPKDEVFEWDATRWRAHEDNVRRMRQRIFKATREGDWARVRSLQKMMLRSWSNTLVSVRQVTQRNTGRRTAGIDGEIALSSTERAQMSERVHCSRSTWDPMPVRRVYVPKANGKGCGSS